MGAEITNQKRKHRTKDIQYHIIGKKNSDIVLPPNIAMFNVQNLSQYTPSSCMHIWQVRTH